MKDLGIYNDSPKDKGKKKVFPGREDHDRPCSSKRWKTRRFWIFMFLLWCAVVFLFGYAKGFQNAEAGQKDSRIVFRKSPAVEFAMLVLLNLEKGITVKDGCVYNGDRHMDDCPCTVKGSAGGGNKHTLLLRAYKYFEDHPDQDWIVNNAIYQYNTTGSWKYRPEPSLRPLTSTTAAGGKSNSDKQ